MVADIEGILMQDVAVLSRIGDDAYKPTNLRGCWRSMPARATDNSGAESTTRSVRVQVPDSGEFTEGKPSGEHWTLSKGDYVLPCHVDVSRETLTSKEAIALVREKGGVAVKSWRDCRRPVDAPGTCGAFASMLHMEG